MKLPEGLEFLPQDDPSEHGLLVKVVEVTPDAAKRWLAFNHKHRDIKDKRVKEYAKTMKGGNWIVNGKTIVFDVEGKLVGGQHRLSACVKSKTSFWGLLVCGVDPGAVEKEVPGDDDVAEAV